MHFSTWDEAKRREWLTWMVENACDSQRDAYTWAITLRSDGSLIGWFGIGGSENPTQQGSRSCGYALLQRYWGQGYMPEAMQAVIDFEVSTLGTRSIVAECDTKNAASARVMQKCGMKYVGTFFDADFEGNWSNRHHYEITSSATPTRFR